MPKQWQGKTQQLSRSARSGVLELRSTPTPKPLPHEVLVSNRVSLVSAGTERMTATLAGKSLLGKARERPDQLRQLVRKVQQDGVVAAKRAVTARLEQPITLGYSSAGCVLGCGPSVSGFRRGDRVASNGAHASVVAVPQHLCALVPETVPDESAAFTVLGAIAMHGVRLSKTSVGETALVVGLGLVGQLTVGILRAAGVRVLGTDPDENRCGLALTMGATLARPGLSATEVERATSGRGADAGLIAAATDSTQPIKLAADAVRKKGRIVLLGVVGLELDRRPFYLKECEFVVSSSYGPGRYDPEYEERGHDYPAAYVRWTEQRNMQAVLDLMAAGQLDVSPLITHRFPIEEADKAYDLVEKGTEPSLGILLTYPPLEGSPQRRVELQTSEAVSGGIGVSFLGAGQFARTTLLPLLGKLDVQPRIVCSVGGLSAVSTGEKHGFAAAASDEAEVFQDSATSAVFVVTRHNEHARQTVAALRAEKHVFVEKPLALSVEELASVETALEESPGRLLTVGFNRRFSPAARQVREFFVGVSQPLALSVRFNPGAIPPEHWTQNAEEGGGRIIGEACHAIDLVTFLAGSPPVRVFAECIGGPSAPPVTDDQCFITLRHANGAVSSVAYLAGGDRALGKERVEALGGGRMAVIEDFRTVVTSVGGRVRKKKSWGQDKGHSAELEAFIAAIRDGGPASIPWSELRAVTLAAILAVRSLREGVPFEIPQV
jgi:predicted dehydrogenase/threonine dehydrogenase-like Zn-dependent dehydrogenase